MTFDASQAPRDTASHRGALAHLKIASILRSNVIERSSGLQGTKRLNRIQSIVYESAYKTNENLLICAPTGAGKTNIAMLTILRELKQHISGSEGARMALIFSLVQFGIQFVLHKV